RFLHPSFTATAAVHEIARGSTSSPRADTENLARPEPGEGRAEEAEPHGSAGVEAGLLGFSVAIALLGIWIAYRFYVSCPERPDPLAAVSPTAYRTLLNKYYVDEIYDATVVSGTYPSGRGLWTFDRQVVDGAVNGSGWATLVGSWVS